MESETRFTPGPWRAHCESDYSSVLADEGDATIEVCYCEAQFADDGTVAANARLIAAAPRMYAMLSDLATCGAIVNSYYTARIKALLAKARGEEVDDGD